MEPRADDDVFVAKPSAEVSKEFIPASLAPNPVAARITSNLRSPVVYNGFAPRPDRVAQVPTVANAQGLYPPDAGIFVAKYVYQNG